MVRTCSCTYMSFCPISSNTQEKAAEREVLSMPSFTPSILFKAWCSFRMAAVTALAVDNWKE